MSSVAPGFRPAARCTAGANRPGTPVELAAGPVRGKQEQLYGKAGERPDGKWGLPFRNDLTVIALDSNYGGPEYIAGTCPQPNLVNVVRIPPNRKVWKKLSQQERPQRRDSNADRRGKQPGMGAPSGKSTTRA